MSSDAIDLMAVLRASQALSSETSIGRLRERVVEVLGAMTGATTVRLLLWDDPQGWILPAPGTAAGDFAPADGPGHRAGALPVQEAGELNLVPLSAFRYAERTREPLLVADATVDDRFARDPYFAGLDQCSLLLVPIVTHGEPKAMLVLENRHVRGAFRADRLDGVMLVAGQLAVSLENAFVYASMEQKVAERTEALEEANAKLETLSTTDPLTGLANRRRLTEELDAEWRRSARSGGAIAVAMVDIDHFKLFNDRFGHMAGDACLKRIAGMLTQSVRDTDVVARYGGEEFVVVLRGADQVTADAVAERIRHTVAALAEPNPDSGTGTLTVSIGVAARDPSGDDTPERLISLADTELYRAKSRGRNRVMSRLRD